MPLPDFSRKQITRTETVTAADGSTYKRHFATLTPEQKAYNKKARAEVLAEFPPPKKSARKKATQGTAARRQRIEVVIGPADAELVTMVDRYATEHQLANRGAVIRVALASLLGFEIKIPHHGWQPGRARKKAATKKKVTARTKTS